jgi:maleylpyruvate isomerase
MAQIVQVKPSKLGDGKSLSSACIWAFSLSEEYLGSPADALSSADRVLRDLTAATDRLLADIAGISGTATREPSLLPDWTRGHVLTHVARNAEGGTRLLTWAQTGVPSYEYESMDARAAAIQAGAGRPAQVLVDDVRQTAAAFAAAARDMPPEAWLRTVRYTGDQEVCADVIVPSRLAEVYIHHVDLDIGFTPADWPVSFVCSFLPRIAAGLSQRDDAPGLHLTALDTGRTFTAGPPGSADMTISGTEPELLAWLLGRSDGRSLGREPGDALPAVPSIY